MRYIVLLVFIGIVLSLTSCRDDFDFEPSTGGLEFSRDTVYLDTVFTNIGSSTYTLKVYNRSNRDIKIPSVRLGEGEQSKYRLMVDGMPGRVFNNVELLARDSLFIFIETTIDYSEYASNETTFLYTDKIEFDNGSNYQKVELVTLVQDAVFIKPDRPLDTGIKETLNINGMPTDIQGHELTTAEELNWTNEKPYVVYGYALVPNGSTLTVNAGARVHFHAESGLIVDDSGTLIINGDYSATEALENEVIFEGDRLEPQFANVAGQWNGIYLLSGSEQNNINHLTLKNAVVGIFIQRTAEFTTPKLAINNSQVYNCTNYGILARQSQISATNLVINNAGQASLSCNLGGIYSFKHCTFANYFNSFNQVPVYVTDYLQGTENIFVSDLTATFENCILYGSSNYGVLLENESEGQAQFNYTFRNCFIKFADFNNQFQNNPLYQFATNPNYISCKIAENSTTLLPDFKDTARNNLAIGENSAAKDMADTNVAAQVPLDIINVARGSDGTLPDTGAYESSSW
mgnify:CR=1 FL=1